MGEMSAMGSTCGRCGGRNPSGFRYCGSCGAALGVAPLPPPDVGPPCWRCHALAPPGTAWCPACGATLAPTGVPAPPPPTGPLPDVPPGSGVEVADGPQQPSLASGLVTVLLAVAIIVILAVVGIAAGRAAGG